MPRPTSPSSTTSSIGTRTEIQMQSKWFGPFNLTDVIKLTRRFNCCAVPGPR